MSTLHANQNSGYLLVHFIGEQPDGEQVYFSYSENGLHWKDLNEGQPVLRSSLGEQGVRDPFIIRSPLDDCFYIIATDLRIANGKGWDIAVHAGSRNVIIWKSEDLVHWSEPWSVTLGIEGAGCVWAPEAIYDQQKEEFLVFWASATIGTNDTERKQKIYSARTKDFLQFTAAEVYIERDNHIIDTTIIEHAGCYYRLSKDETTKNITLEKGSTLEKDAFMPVSAPNLEAIYGVEGPQIFKLNDREAWCLIIDRFAEGKGYLPLLSSDLNNGEFKVVDEAEFDLGKTKKRHGSVISITADECARLIASFGDGHQVLAGQFADPDLAKFGDRYYLYPTTDGFTHWSGTEFHVFSSSDLRNWKDEGVIVDVASDQVPWSIGSAWAPAIASKNEKYYFYFCGRMSNDTSAIGVAVADSPIGPFTPVAKPLITLEQMNRLSIKMGQTIDPAIYTDEDGISYLLFGNCEGAIIQLGEDMVSVHEETMANLSGLYDFREAVTVLKRGGKYHFTWSCDDTGSEDYHVNYGTADHLYGPITYHYPILVKNESKDMLGTGHHSIMQDPDTGEYWIAYHRFVTPLTRFTDGKGFHREVCIDRITFDENGFMMPVKL